MFSWASCAAVCASCSNRMHASPELAELEAMTLTATSTRSCAWRATQMDPIPPAATWRSSRYFPPTTVPGVRAISSLPCRKRRRHHDRRARYVKSLERNFEVVAAYFQFRPRLVLQGERAAPSCGEMDGCGIFVGKTGTLRWA